MNCSGTMIYDLTSNEKRGRRTLGCVKVTARLVQLLTPGRPSLGGCRSHSRFAIILCGLVVGGQTRNAAPNSCKPPIEEPQLPFRRGKRLILALEGLAPTFFRLFRHGRKNLKSKNKAPPFTGGFGRDAMRASGGPSAPIRSKTGSEKIVLADFRRRAPRSA